MSPFCRRSELDRSESEGEDMVAATRAAMAASSPSGFPEDFLDSPSLLLPPPPLEPSLVENRSLRNSGASNEGSFTVEAAVDSDLRPSEAVLRASAAVSLAVLIQACDFSLSSAHWNEDIGRRT